MRITAWLWSMFKVGLLITNAVAILHKQRFLSKYNLVEIDRSASASTLKNQVIGLITAVQYLRGPLIVANTFTLVVELLFGGI
ncbi:unnamed protein product [Discosporangium mesarthrocarpum]